MKQFRAADFVKTGNDLHFGPDYDGYGAVQLRHVKTGKAFDVLVHVNGMPVSRPDPVTRRLKEHMKLGNSEIKIVAIVIEGSAVLSILFPDIFQ